MAEMILALCTAAKLDKEQNNKTQKHYKVDHIRFIMNYQCEGELLEDKNCENLYHLPEGYNSSRLFTVISFHECL